MLKDFLAQIKPYLSNIPSYVFEKLETPDRAVEVSFIVKIQERETVLKGYRIQHNNVHGPYKGGIRFSPFVSKEEVNYLAFWMSIKTAVANVPFGGGKGGVIVDTKKLTQEEIEAVSRAYIRAIADIIGPTKDVPAPDMYTNPQIMKWMMDEYSKIVGKPTPAVITGKPIKSGGSQGRIEATGLGGFYILESLVRDYNLKDVKIAVQGFGNAGYHFAKFAQEAGFTIVAVSDSQGGVYSENGLDIDKVKEYKTSTGSVINTPDYQHISNKDLLTLNVTVLVPAAKEDVITEENAANIRARYIIELANGPITLDADTMLEQKGTVIVPDVLANSGGVTVSYFEWYQNMHNEVWSKDTVFNKLKDYITNAYNGVVHTAKEHDVSLRKGAYIVAVKRIADKMLTNNG